MSDHTAPITTGDVRSIIVDGRQGKSWFYQYILKAYMAGYWVPFSRFSVPPWTR